MRGLIIDNFAGGGGASTGIEQALGRPIDIAINHDMEAVLMHAANHPHTLHHCQSVWKADPLDITDGDHVSLAWFSPDCKHFSKAKGGKPRAKHIRDLAWVVVLWAKRAKPDVIMLENVEEFRTWGPLDQEGFPIKDRAGETFEKWTAELRKAGYKIQWRELRACDYGAPTSRKRFFMIARRDGKPIVWPEPTHGKPGTPEVESGLRKPWRTAAEIIDWSIPCPSIFERKKELAEATLKRIAAGIVRFVLHNPRPFIVPITHTGSDTRVHSADEPLRTVTTAHRGELAVIAPYFARTAHGEIDRNGKKRGKGSHAADDTFPTVTTSQDSAVIQATLVSPVIVGCGGRRGQSGPVDPQGPYPTSTAKADACLVAPTLVQVGYGEREGQAPRALDVEAPLGTVVAGGTKHAAVTAFLSKFASGNVPTEADEPTQTVEAVSKLAVVTAYMEQANTGMVGHSAEKPVSTIVGRGTTQRLVTSNLVKLQNNQDAKSVDEPIETIMASGLHYAEVRAFLIKYYGIGPDGHTLEAPLGSVTTKDRFGLITVSIEGEEYAIADIGMRMLSARELFNAQGFPPDYIIDPIGPNGKPLTKTSQIAKCGNSVCPDLSRALVEANFADEIEARRSVAA